jgi:hypothetical protein
MKLSKFRQPLNNQIPVPGQQLNNHLPAFKKYTGTDLTTGK